MQKNPFLSKKFGVLPFFIFALTTVAVSPAEAVCYQGKNCVTQQPNRMYVPQVRPRIVTPLPGGQRYVPQTQV